jgi:aminoglycoside phosphotransferase (APT) family kinase protein
MAELTTLLLRAIARELAERVIPELHSADAIERANFAGLIAQNLASDIDVLPGLATGFLPRFRQAITSALARLAEAGAGERLDACRREFAAIGPATSAAGVQFEVTALRELLARLLRDLADASDPEAASARASRLMASLGELGGVDCDWRIALEAAKAAANAQGAAPAGTAAASAQGAPQPDPTPAALTRHLRAHFPDAPGLAVTAIVPIPGGRSKKTFFISLRDSGGLPSELVMRQDYALKYAGTKVREEYQPLLTLAGLGLPVPRPVHLSPEPGELGPPFILVEKLEGKPPGSYFGMQGTCPGAFRDMARTLARLHRIAPAQLGLTPPPATQDCMATLIDQYRRKWRDNATLASPLVDYAYAWARQECAREPGSMAFVHGDSGPYNFLVKDDRLTALLDWEFARIGDPAEDLGIARCYAEGSIPWAEFLEIYRAAGGPQVPERRVQLGMLIQFLKGTTLVAASGRNFKEGGTTEFIKGANAYTGQKLIELKIAELLKRFQAA